MTSIEPLSTKSEILFERFCKEKGISCAPIECDGKKADYDIDLQGLRIVTEVKQIDRNESDINTWEKVKARGAVAACGNSDHRVRLKIQEARKQLKARSEGKLPTLLVIYDNGTFAGTDENDIKTAIFGDEKVVVSTVDHQVVNISPIHAGGNRQFTFDSNTSISAIALMYGDEPRLSVFHNKFAAIPIDPDWMRMEGVKHFKLDTAVYDWTQV
jgi:hypothetical protein